MRNGIGLTNNVLERKRLRIPKHIGYTFQHREFLGSCAPITIFLEEGKQVCFSFYNSTVNCIDYRYQCKHFISTAFICQHFWEFSGMQTNGQKTIRCSTPYKNVFPCLQLIRYQLKSDIPAYVSLSSCSIQRVVVQRSNSTVGKIHGGDFFLPLNFQFLLTRQDL